MTTNVRTVLTVMMALLVAAVFGDLVAAPVHETKGDVVLLHGGIGMDDRAAMEAKASEHNLKLTFARKGSGAYLSDVKVVVKNKQGVVLVDTVASGPWLLAKLPAGDYTVSATERDDTLTQNIAIKGNARRDWVFRFELPKGVAQEFDAGK